MKTATAKDVHKECDNQARVLVKEANAIISKSLNRDNNLISKIREMGFGNSTSVKDDKQTIKMANATVRYKLLYPQNNFLTEEAVEKICKKYGLLFAEAKDFIGEIPVKNQMEMANFELANDDMPIFAIDKDEFKKCVGRIKAIKIKLKSAGIIESIALTILLISLKVKYQKRITKREFNENANNLSLRKYLKPEFKIIATAENLNLQGKKVVGKYKLVDKDPVVLCAVEGGWLQVSEWGDEASFNEFGTANKN